MPDQLQTGSLQSFASVIDDAALRFEEAWARSPAALPGLEAFLPEESQARERAALRLAQIDIERRTAAGYEPQVESYLARFPTLAADDDDVFALVLTEAETRLRHGKPLDPDTYRGRFPKLVDRLISRLLHRSLPQVPGYEILGELGRGGMGVVYKARQTKLNRVVALKVITAPDRQAITRFLLEAEAVAAVHHPHVIQVFDSGEYSDLPYLAMEFVEGGSLRDLLKRTPILAPRDAATLVADVADGVNAVHEAGIVHRDLKPANILLSGVGNQETGVSSGFRNQESGVRKPVGFDSSPTPDSRLPTPDPRLPTPKVSDFGLALRGGVELTQTQGKFLGTPAYAAPEQAAGRREYIGFSADVWALGVILYECLTGQRPFDGDDPLSVLQAVQTKPAPALRSLNNSVPRDLELICLKCLEKDLHARYPTASALADDLRRYLDGKPVTARPVGLVTQGIKWVRRNPVPTALVATMLIGSIATSGAALIARDNARAAAAADASRLTAEQEASASAIRQLDAERAQAAERQKRDRAEQEAAVSAALQENDLQRVVDVVKAAERAGLVVPVESRFAAASALTALGNIDEARDKMKALVAVKELPPALRAKVELWLADLLYGVDDERAVELLASARKSGQLSPADLAYVDAIEADTMPESIAMLLAAVRIDPRHFPARRLLGLCLVTTGRHDDAIRVGEVSRLLSRNHPDVLWSLFLAYGLKGEATRTREMFALLRPHIRPDLVNQFEMLAKYLPAINAQFRASVSGEPEPLGDLYKELQDDGGAGSVMQPLRATNAIRSSLLGRMPASFRDALDDYLDFSFAATTPGRNYIGELTTDEAKLARLKGNLERRPEGFMLFVYAIALHDRAFDYLAKHGKATPHTNRFRIMCLQSADAYLFAAESPGLIDVRSVALEGAALHYALAARPGWIPEQDADRAAFAKATEMVRRRLALPEPIPTVWLELHTRLCTNAGDITTARRILDDWEKREPESIVAATRRAHAEFKGEAFIPALRAARKALAQQPKKDAKLLQIEAECLSKLRRDPDLPPVVAPEPRPAFSP